MMFEIKDGKMYRKKSKKKKSNSFQITKKECKLNSCTIGKSRNTLKH